MKKIRVWVELNCVNPINETVIEVPDDATSEQIEDAAINEVEDMICWGWEVEEDG